MTKNRLLGGIKACKGELERAEKWAARYYASYKNGGDWQDYQKAQHYYERCEKMRKQLQLYEEMLRNGEYE
jgi:hypothetical protein